MKKIVAFLSFFLLLNSFASEISLYQVKNYCILKDGEEYRVIREFYKSDERYILAVNSTTLKTSIYKAIDANKSIKCQNSKLSKLLKRSLDAPYPLQNDGINSFEYGIYLTVDMCPSSKKGYERKFFKEIIKRFANPVPITIFVTKRWIKSHIEAFKELKRWDSEGKLSIIWGNHTAYHFYKRGVALKQNFVLNRHEHFRDDVLEMERYLISMGVVPSIFFRFPGLVSNKRVIDTLSDLSLVVVGTDAWIAKGELPKDGSIILVHGNKNEHIGIKKLLRYFETKELYELNSMEKAL